MRVAVASARWGFHAPQTASAIGFWHLKSLLDIHSCQLASSVATHVGIGYGVPAVELAVIVVGSRSRAQPSPLGCTPALPLETMSCGGAGGAAQGFTSRWSCDAAISWCWGSGETGWGPAVGEIVALLPVGVGDVAPVLLVGRAVDQIQVASSLRRMGSLR